MKHIFGVFYCNLSTEKLPALQNVRTLMLVDTQNHITRITEEHWIILACFFPGITKLAVRCRRKHKQFILGQTETAASHFAAPQFRMEFIPLSRSSEAPFIYSKKAKARKQVEPAKGQVQTEPPSSSTISSTTK